MAATRTEIVPTGRVELEGRVLALEWRGHEFGATLKAMIRCATFDVWGTAPYLSIANPFDPARPHKARVQVGDIVRFKATCEPCKEVGFGFYKRPSVAEVIGTAD